MGKAKQGVALLAFEFSSVGGYTLAIEVMPPTGMGQFMHHNLGLTWGRTRELAPFYFLDGNLAGLGSFWHKTAHGPAGLLSGALDTLHMRRFPADGSSSSAQVKHAGSQTQILDAVGGGLAVFDGWDIAAIGGTSHRASIERGAGCQANHKNPGLKAPRGGAGSSFGDVGIECQFLLVILAREPQRAA